jgi:hypothetical protein
MDIEAELRFKVGTKVLARLADGWHDGMITQQWWDGQPYQILVTDLGHHVYAPKDDDMCVKKHPDANDDEDSVTTGGSSSAEDAATGDSGNVAPEPIDETLRSLERYMLSLAYLVSWGSQIKQDKPKLLSEVPLHDILVMHMGLGSRIITWVIKNPSKRDQLLDQLPSVAFFGQSDNRHAKNAKAEDKTLELSKSRSSLGCSEQKLQGKTSWKALPEKPLQCVVEIESAHPYPSNINTYEVFEIEACESIELHFNPACCTEEDHDIISIYAGAEFSVLIRSLSGMGPWPGTDGLPPLVIPGNKFGIRFQTDKDIGGWGYRIEARADVNRQICEDIVKGLSGTVNYKDVEKAVAEAMKSAECVGRGSDTVKAAATDAVTRSISSSFKKNKEADEDEGTGFYRKGKGDAQVQVNVQSGEVLLAGRMLVPVRADVADEEAYKDVFGNSIERKEGTDYCAELARRENCRKLAVMRPEGPYNIVSEILFALRLSTFFIQFSSLVRVEAAHQLIKRNDELCESTSRSLQEASPRREI